MTDDTHRQSRSSRPRSSARSSWSSSAAAPPSSSGGDYVATGLAFGLTVLVMAYAVGRISGGHFNPAVTIGAAIGGRLSWLQVAVYIGAQLAGAIAARPVAVRPAPRLRGLRRRGQLGQNSFGDEGSGYAWWAAFLLEALMTMVFIMVILAVTDSRNEHPALAPLAIGLALTMIHFASIAATGTSVNPARSIGVGAVRRHRRDHPALAVHPGAAARRRARRAALPAALRQAPTPVPARACASAAAAPAVPCPATVPPTSTSSSGTSRTPAAVAAPGPAASAAAAPAVRPPQQQAQPQQYAATEQYGSPRQQPPPGHRRSTAAWPQRTTGPARSTPDARADPEQDARRRPRRQMSRRGSTAVSVCGERRRSSDAAIEPPATRLLEDQADAAGVVLVLDELGLERGGVLGLRRRRRTTRVDVDRLVERQHLGLVLGHARGELLLVAVADPRLGQHRPARPRRRRPRPPTSPVGPPRRRTVVSSPKYQTLPAGSWAYQSEVSSTTPAVGVGDHVVHDGRGRRPDLAGLVGDRHRDRLGSAPPRLVDPVAARAAAAARGCRCASTKSSGSGDGRRDLQPVDARTDRSSPAPAPQPPQRQQRRPPARRRRRSGRVMRPSMSHGVTAPCNPPSPHALRRC